MYGYDFRNYAFSSVRRRIWHRVHAEKLPTITALQERVLHDRSCMERLLADMTIHVTEMFRDPEMFLAFRQKVVPLLRTYPFIRIWHAGCSSGEEVYSMAILLHEEGLYNKTRIYATDTSSDILERAKTGVFPLERMQLYTRNYMEAGGKTAFSEYYTAKYDSVIFNSEFKRNIVFAQHNLVTDSSFNEFNVILCRNVMIYFNKQLQDHVHHLLYDSLSRSECWRSGRRSRLISHRIRMLMMNWICRTGCTARSDRRSDIKIWGEEPVFSAEQPINILLVDDNPDNLLAIEAVIGDRNYNLVKCFSGEEALRRLMKDDYAVIVMDVQMPGMDGFETARLIKAREKTKEIPIIFISATSRNPSISIPVILLGPLTICSSRSFRKFCVPKSTASSTCM